MPILTSPVSLAPSSSIASKIILRSLLLLASTHSFTTSFHPSPRPIATLPPTPIRTSIQMSSQPQIIPHITPPTLQDLLTLTTSFSATHGIQVYHTPTQSYITAPISLLPQSYPSHLFVRGCELARPLNELVDRISRDGRFLRETLRDVRVVDWYTGKLLELYEDIYLGTGDDSAAATTTKGEAWGKFARMADRLGIQRSDYMLHDTGKEGEGGYALKQVELNTIASSFAGLASSVAKLHGFLTERMECDGGRLNEFLEENHKCVISGGTIGDSITGTSGDGGVPESPAMVQLPLAISLAHDRYCQRFVVKESSSNTHPTVLFVVQPNETNTVDQRMLEFALWKNHKVPVIRMSLAELYEKATFNDTNGQLVIHTDHGDKEVTVIYFRAGYAPTDYPSGYNTQDGSGIEWLARERLERSRATKCPCLGYHLAGTKKVQQELARPGVVERFFPESVDDTAKTIRTVFAGLFSLGADATEQDLDAVKEVLFEGGEGRYVLKPQREGGGYNYYGQNLAEKLKENCTIVEESQEVRLNPALSEFILMERLFPPQQCAILLRNGKVEGSGMTISELGCFGTILATEDAQVVHNEYGGFLLRTKFSGVDEGGVASGFATLSSPYLC